MIGTRGSGKTALADLIAAGGLALSPHLNERSFILRAKNYLGDSEATLKWASEETTGNHLANIEIEDILDTQHVQYLSQQFVDQLCSADGLNDSLVAEIERVIFNAHPLTDRLGSDSFKELLGIRLESSRQKRERQQQTLSKASSDLTDERVKKNSLRALEKDRDEKIRAINKDKNDRKTLVAKGNEERSKRHEQVSLAVDAKRLQVEQAKRKHQALLHLQNDVLDFRSRQAPSLLTDLKAQREETGLEHGGLGSIQGRFRG